MTIEVLDPKAAGEGLVHGFDWAQELGNDTIDTVAWSFSPAGDLTASNEEKTDTTASLRIAGGVPGGRYTITCAVTTAGGQDLEKSWLLPVVGTR